MSQHFAFRWRFGLSSLFVALVLVGLGARGARWHLDGQREIEWEAFSEDRLSKYTTQGRVVLVAVNADWDPLTLVQMQYFDTPDVRRAAYNRGVVPLWAEWSEQSHDISDFMRSVGGINLPLVVVYPRDKSVLPIVLRGDYDAEQLVDAIEVAAR